MLLRASPKSGGWRGQAGTGSLGEAAGARLPPAAAGRLPNDAATVASQDGPPGCAASLAQTRIGCFESISLLFQDGLRGARSRFPHGRRTTGASDGEGASPYRRKRTAPGLRSGSRVSRRPPLPPSRCCREPAALRRRRRGPAPRPGCGWPGVPHAPVPWRRSSAALI